MDQMMLTEKYQKLKKHSLKSIAMLFLMAALPLYSLSVAYAEQGGDPKTWDSEVIPCKGLKPYNNIDELITQFYLNIHSNCLSEKSVDELEKIWETKILDEERRKPKNYYPLSETEFYNKPYKTEKDAFYIEISPEQKGDRRVFLLKATKEYFEKRGAPFNIDKLYSLLPDPKKNDMTVFPPDETGPAFSVQSHVTGHIVRFRIANNSSSALAQVEICYQVIGRELDPVRKVDYSASRKISIENETPPFPGKTKEMPCRDLSSDIAELKSENCLNLMQSVQNGDQQKILNLIQNGLNINIECKVAAKSIQTGFDVPLTPLIAAVESGNLSMAAFLLDQGADINQIVTIEDSKGLIHYLGSPRKVYIAEPLNKSAEKLSGASNLESHPSPAIVKISISPLMAAILMRNAEMVNLLLKRGAQPDNTYELTYLESTPNRSKFETCYPLRMAKNIRNNKIILSLLEYDVDLDRDAEIAPPYVLTFLIENEASITEIQKAVALGLDVNRRSALDELFRYATSSPLSMAVKMGDVDAADFLINNGARLSLNPEKLEDDQRLYTLAADKPAMFRYLQKTGLKPIVPSFFSKNKSDPIMSAIYSDDAEIITELVKMGFNPNDKSFGQAPLHLAAAMKRGVNPAALKTLIKNGANVNVKFTRKCGEFEYPCSRLEELGDVTPLMYAVYHHPNPYETVDLLIKSGAKVKAKTKSGVTAGDIWRARTDYCLRNRFDDGIFSLSFFENHVNCSVNKGEEITRLLK